MDICLIEEEPHDGEVSAASEYPDISNARDGWTFDQVVLALKNQFDRQWDVVPIEGYRHDQRLAGHEGLIRPLADRLG